MEEYALPSSPSEYMIVFRGLAALTKAVLENEAERPEKERHLERLAMAVETVSALRGDDGRFSELEPGGITEYRNEMYVTENALRSQLIALGYIYPSK